MVRYDKCVEALYDGAAMDDKQKTLQILKVMKGAISVSKSKTGECIFRSNKVENVNLQRLVRCHKKDSQYQVARIDTSKKSVVNRWSKLLENQTSCSAETLFGEILDVDTPDLSSGKDRSYLMPSPVRMSHEKDDRLRKLLDARLSRYDSHPKIVIRKRRRHEFSSRPTTAESEIEENHVTNSDGQFVSERPDIRDKYQNEVEQKHSEQKVVDLTRGQRGIPIRLPDIVAHQGFKFKRPNSSHEEEESRVELERDLSDWGNWSLKDKTWINRYINKEKTRQEDLLLRNALNNIEKEMSGANMIKRHQIRQKLQVEKERDAIERRKAEAVLCRQLTTSSLNIPNGGLPVLTPPIINTQSHLPDSKNRQFKVQPTSSPRLSPTNKKKGIFPAKSNPLSKALEQIDTSVNGLSVIIEHPAVAKKRKGAVIG